ncbi:hypothetical protein GC176_12630, partial [bacterium]|nr:hypothetical protein [bacterium]
MKYVVLSVSVTVCVIAASAALPAEQPARLSGSRSLMDQADRLVSAGENQLALKYYAYALALDPHGELPSGRLAGFLQTLNENGLSEPNWNVFPIPVEASGGVSDEQTAGDRIALARRLAVGRIVPLEASLERLKQRLPQEADLQTIDREDTAWIHPVSEIVPELNQTIADAIAPAAVGRTRPRGVLIYPDFRQALRLGSELRRLAADIGQLDGMLPVETDELTRKGVEFVVQAAAVRQTIDRVLELAQESVAFPENSQDYLARAAAASFPTDRLRSQALSTRLIELEPDRIADLMRARSVFDPVRRGDAQTAVNHFVRCLQSSHQSTGLTPDL